jgi:tRNA-dihydrouridine synthase A
VGLLYKANGVVPPLDYARVYQLKADFPALTIIINGGIRSLADVRGHLQHVDGVMLGREAYHNPWILAEIEAGVFNRQSGLTRHGVLTAFLPYLEKMLASGVRLSAMSRHLLGLFQGLPGSRQWRRHISEQGHLSGAGIEVIIEAMQHVPAIGESF